MLLKYPKALLFLWNLFQGLDVSLGVVAGFVASFCGVELNIPLHHKMLNTHFPERSAHRFVATGFIEPDGIVLGM